LVEHWDGISWTIVPTPNVGDGPNALNGIAAAGPNDIWSVGYQSVVAGSASATLVLHFDGASWNAGSGAFFDVNSNGRRPDGWTSADAAGLAILPGLVRYDEVFGTGEINHALRSTVRSTNGYVYPASHSAGSRAGALPMGARLRMKAGRDISAYRPEIQKIFRAMKRYGLIVADNGSDMYVSGAYDTRWDNGVLNPAFHSMTASDFEVVQLAYTPAGPAPRAPTNLRIAP
jgi:hypothetical protein